MNRNGLLSVGIVGMCVVGVAAFADGPGGGGPVCRYSIHEQDNTWFNAECTRVYYCCVNQYGVDHGPFSNAGAYSSLGTPVSTTCHGTIYTAAIIDGACVDTGAFVGNISCSVQLYPDPVSCP